MSWVVKRVVLQVGASLILAICDLLRLDWIWRVMISHTYRETNKCADALANRACHMKEEFFLWPVIVFFILLELCLCV